MRPFRISKDGGGALRRGAVKRNTIAL